MWWRFGGHDVLRGDGGGGWWFGGDGGFGGGGGGGGLGVVAFGRVTFAAAAERVGGVRVDRMEMVDGDGGLLVEVTSCRIFCRMGAPIISSASASR